MAQVKDQNTDAQKEMSIYKQKKILTSCNIEYGIPGAIYGIKISSTYK